MGTIMLRNPTPEGEIRSRENKRTPKSQTEWPLIFLKNWGYFPISFPLDDEEESSNGHRIKKLLNVTKFIPNLLMIFVFFCVLLILALSPSSASTYNWNGSEGGTTERVTFFMTNVLKQFSHAVCIIVVEFSLICNRSALFSFYREFSKRRSHLLRDSSLGQMESGMKRDYNLLFAFLWLLTILLMVELMNNLIDYNGAGRDPSWGAITVYFLPAAAGYVHSVCFAMLLVHFLNGFIAQLDLILQERFPETIDTGDQMGITVIESKKKGISPSSLSFDIYHHDVKSIYRSAAGVVEQVAYKEIWNQVEQFNRIFSLGIAIDFGHSILRGVVGGYFLMSGNPSKDLWHSKLDNFTTLAMHFGLIFCICAKGSKLADKGAEIRRILEAFDNDKLPKINLRSAYFLVNLNLIPQILGTITTYLIVLVQFQGSGSKSKS